MDDLTHADWPKNAQKIGSAKQDLPSLRQTLCLAEEMGSGLGQCPLLFGTVPADREGRRRRPRVDAVTDLSAARAEGDEGALNDILTSVWRDLVRGSVDRRSPWRWAAVASIGEDGRPRTRTVVLRSVDAQVPSIEIHTDRRSDKVAEWTADPRASALFFNARSATQIRIEGRVEFPEQSVRRAVWDALHPGSRAPYLAALPPGAPRPASTPSNRGAEAAFGDFVVVRLRIETLDWLRLAPEGHVRARFGFHADRVASGATSASFVTP